jgi:hypothetical protein
MSAKLMDVLIYLFWLSFWTLWVVIFATQGYKLIADLGGIGCGAPK